jgi:TolA-binding protein
MLRRGPLSALLLALVAPGCFAMKSEVQSLDWRIGAIERADVQRRQLLIDAQQQVAALNEQLEQARAQTRNMADLGARLDGIEEQLRSLRGALDEVRVALQTSIGEETSQRTQLAQQLSGQLTTIERRITEVERRVGLAPAVEANQIPSAPAEIVAQARQAYANRDYVRTRALANALLQRPSPEPNQAAAARLLLGMVSMQENRAAAAAQEFQRLLTDYPTSDSVPEAMAQMSEAFVRLGWCTQAQRTLRLLIDRHGSTPQGQAARRRLEEVRRLPRAACTQ